MDEALIVIDTSVLIAQLRKSSAAQRFLKAQPLRVVSSLAAFELWQGARTSGERQGVAALLAACRIEPFTAALAEQAGFLHQELAAKGRRKSSFDLLIASHALQNRAPLATMDRDYEGIPGLKVVKVR